MTQKCSVTRTLISLIRFIRAVALNVLVYTCTYMWNNPCNYVRKPPRNMERHMAGFDEGRSNKYGPLGRERRNKEYGHLVGRKFSYGHAHTMSHIQKSKTRWQKACKNSKTFSRAFNKKYFCFRQRPGEKEIDNIFIDATGALFLPCNGISAQNCGPLAGFAEGGGWGGIPQISP